MPDLSNTTRWVEHEPDLLGNRESDLPFYFLLHGSMSKAQMRALDEALDRRTVVPATPADATPEQAEQLAEAERQELVKKYATALEPYVRLGEEPLTVDGRSIATLAEYFDFVTGPAVSGLGLLIEPVTALMGANRMDARATFSLGRRSGGPTSMRRSRSRGRTAAR